MDRRELLGAVGGGLLGAAGIGAAAAQAAVQEPDHVHLDEIHRQCLDACAQCAQTCDLTVHHCLELVGQGRKEHAQALRLVSDCAGFCGLAAGMIARHSPLMVHSCQACAEACKSCAETCERQDDPFLKRCARICRDCERQCREMVATLNARRSRA